MDIDAKFYEALSPLDVPVSKPPGDTAAETYVTFHEVLGKPTAYASNQPRRTYHMVQVHTYSRRDDGTHRTVHDAAIALLQDAGIRVRSWGPDTYETDTQIHHIATTCECSE